MLVRIRTPRFSQDVKQPVPNAMAAQRNSPLQRSSPLVRIGSALVMALVFSLAAPNVGRASAAEDCNEGQGQIAIRGCTEIIKSGKLSPENLATAHLNRAIAFSNEGKLDKARKDLDRSIELSPKDPLLFYNRGNIAIDQGELAVAIHDFTAAVSLDPSFALAYLNRGLANEAAGSIAASIEDYRMALSLDHTLTPAQEGLKRLEPHTVSPSSGS